MEKKIRKTALLYGIAAILLASLLAAMIFNVNLIQVEYASGNPPVPAAHSSLIAAFQSEDQLRAFLLNHSTIQGPFVIYGDIQNTQGIVSRMVFGATTSGETFEDNTLVPLSTDNSWSHSTTNIQVKGVDEADTVKIDNRGYMYVLSGTTVYILKAYPYTQAIVVSRITFADMYPVGIFVNGQKLTVIGSEFHYSPMYRPYYVSDPKTFAKVYDVSIPSVPRLIRDLSLSGSYFNSRMIGDYVYFVVNKEAYLINETLVLPEFNSDGKVIKITPGDIYYANATDNYYQYTTFVAMNMKNTTESPVYMTLMLGGTCNMYVSTTNMYITYQGWNWDGNSTIYRISINGNKLTAEAKGTVPGHERNQFSMDEYNGTFRIETTNMAPDYETQTNLYVLGMNLSIIGRLEGLAPGENFHSARFMGERAYFVTFKKTDPLFVIGLSKPTEPEVLGELHIPGYSDYLHPYDDTHIIGVGKNTIESEVGDFAWYQGIKISLFDVSNVSNPIQMSNITIGDRGSDSIALYDHKSFLFDHEKNLLVIPILEARIDASPYGQVPPYGTPVAQGAYVFEISLSNGIELKGNITHIDNPMNLNDATYHVTRSCYIENTLYTVSGYEVKVNSLENWALNQLNEIRLF